MNQKVPLSRWWHITLDFNKLPLALYETFRKAVTGGPASAGSHQKQPAGFIVPPSIGIKGGLANLTCNFVSANTEHLLNRCRRSAIERKGFPGACRKSSSVMEETSLIRLPLREHSSLHSFKPTHTGRWLTCQLDTLQIYHSSSTQPDVVPINLSILALGVMLICIPWPYTSDRHTYSLESQLANKTTKLMFKADGVLSGETENYFLLRKRDTYLLAMRQSLKRCQIYGTADT